MDLETAIKEKNFAELKEHIEASIQVAISEAVEDLRESLIRRTDRVRGGEVQRNKIVRGAGADGYKIQGGKAVRVSAQEKNNRKLSQRKAAVKRASKMMKALMKRNISLRKRSAAGLDN